MRCTSKSHCVGCTLPGAWQRFCTYGWIRLPAFCRKETRCCYAGLWSRTQRGYVVGCQTQLFTSSHSKKTVHLSIYAFVLFINCGAAQWTVPCGIDGTSKMETLLLKFTWVKVNKKVLLFGSITNKSIDICVLIKMQHKYRRHVIQKVAFLRRMHSPIFGLYWVKLVNSVNCFLETCSD